MALTDDIAAYLQVNGIGTVDTDIFIDFMPDEPDDVVVLYEYAGMPTTTGVDAVDRRVQVNVRAARYLDARTKAWNIFNLLDIPENRIIQATAERWIVSQALQTPHKIGVDNQGRDIFVFNLAVATSRD